MVLDGDNLRFGMNADLGFDEASRTEAVRRVGHICALMQQAGIVSIVSMVSPIAQDREAARKLFDAGRFLEVYVDTPLAECERRDPKGHYKRARTGDLPNFTGIDAPYEAPINPQHRLLHYPDADTLVETVAAEVIAIAKK